jgi:hypothetical protein
MVECWLQKNMTKSIGIAGFGVAFGIPVLAVVAGGVVLAGACVAIGYLAGGAAGAGGAALAVAI